MAEAEGSLSSFVGRSEDARCQWEKCGNVLRIRTGNRKCATCDRCYHVTCFRCSASHEGVSCRTYQKSRQEPSTPLTPQEVNEEPAEYVYATCLAVDCNFQTVVEANAVQVTCGRCGSVTCLSCDAIHEFKTCEEQRAEKSTPDAPAEHDTDDAEQVSTLECDACGTRGPVEDIAEIYSCRHNVCRLCVEMSAQSSLTYLVGCPVKNGGHRCDSHMSDQTLGKHVSEATLSKRNELRSLPLRRCATSGCAGKCNVRPRMDTFQCDRCLQINCIDCCTIHSGMNCREHVEWLVAEQEGDYTVSDLVNRLGLEEDGIGCGTKGCTGVGYRTEQGSYCRACGQYTCLECHVVHDFETCAEYKSGRQIVQPQFVVTAGSEDDDSH